MNILRYPSHSYSTITESWEYYKEHYDETFTAYRKWLWEEWKVKIPNQDDPIFKTYSVEFHDEHLMTLFMLRFTI